MIDTEKRDRIIDQARAKYIDTGKTRNITEALKLYLEADAGPDEQVPLYITSPEIHQMRAVLEQVRPRCDECNAELHLQMGAHDPSGKSYPTAWVCKKCGKIEYSELTPKEWLEDLRIETRKQNLSGADKPYGPAMPAMRQKPEI